MSKREEIYEALRYVPLGEIRGRIVSGGDGLWSRLPLLTQHMGFAPLKVSPAFQSGQSQSEWRYAVGRHAFRCLSLRAIEACRMLPTQLQRSDQLFNGHISSLLWGLLQYYPVTFLRVEIDGFLNEMELGLADFLFVMSGRAPCGGVTDNVYARIDGDAHMLSAFAGGEIQMPSCRLFGAG